MSGNENGNGRVKIGKLEIAVASLARSVDLLRTEQKERYDELRTESDHRYEDLRESIQTVFKKMEAENKEIFDLRKETFDIRQIVSVLSTKYEANTKADEKLKATTKALEDRQAGVTQWWQDWGMRIILSILILLLGIMFGPLIKSVFKAFIGGTL